VNPNQRKEMDAESLKDILGGIAIGCMLIIGLFLAFVL
jgi:hypothetical protein